MNALSFMEYLIVAPFVIFFFGFCIFIHELGHFLAAKWRGLHIVAFSIGFKKVWSFKRGGIEYRIGCIPCGGYVELPQIDATGQSKDEFGNPLPPVKPIDKIITTAAGPLFNVLFAVVLGLVVWWQGVPLDTPKMRSFKVATIDSTSPEYAAGLREGDVITSFDGAPFHCTWSDFARKVIFAIGKVTLGVERDGKHVAITYKPIPNLKRTPRNKVAYPFFTPSVPLKCDVVPDSPAWVAGMRPGDIITAVNDTPIGGYSEFQTAMIKNRGEPLDITISRDGKTIVISNLKPKVISSNDWKIGLGLGESLRATVVSTRAKGANAKAFVPGDELREIDGTPIISPLDLGNAIITANGKPLKILVSRQGKPFETTVSFPPSKANTKTKAPAKGVYGELEVKYKYDSPIWATSALSGLPADKAGIKPYDRLLKVNDKNISSVKMFLKEIANSGGRNISIEIERHAKKSTLNVVPERAMASDIGIRLVWIDHPTPWHQFKNVMVLTYKSVRGIIAGLTNKSTLRPSHLSGPVGIFNGIAITFARQGLMPALALIVLISYSLALLNLMPIPALDGGHIVMALYEMIFKKPLPAKLVQPSFIIVFALLISLMLYVTFYDSLRMMSESKIYKFKYVSAATSASDDPLDKTRGSVIVPSTVGRDGEKK